MADEGLAKKDRICQFFASNAGLHFRSVDVAAALGLDARSVGQQLARLWRSGFVEKVQTGPFTTWRMKFQTYPGRNLHGPAAPKPAGLTLHTPAKKSTRGSRTLEEGRNDSGHCAMGSSVVFGSTEGGNQEGEEDETEDQGSCLVEAHSVRVPEYHSSSSKPPAATRDRPTSTQNISSQCKAAENLPIKKTVGRPPGNKNKMSTTCQIGQRGSKTGKTTSTSGSCKKKTSAPVKRRVGHESFRNADQGSRLKGKKTTSQTTGKEDCSSRSITDSESTPLKIVSTGLKRKAGVESTTTNQGLKKKVKKTWTQTTEREDCRGRSASDSGLSTQVQKKTQLMPSSVSYQKTTATAVKKKTDQGQKRRMKKTTSPNTEGYSSSTCSTSGKDSLQYNSPLMPATLAPSLNRPSGNMETKLMNFIREAQGMLVMTGDDVAKALGSKPKETHRLLLHMQRTGRVRKVCDKPTRWMMLGQGKGGPARKRQTEATTTTQQKEVPSLTTAQQKEPPQTKHQELSTQAYRSLFIDGSPTRRRQEKATTTTQQKEPTKHQVPSTQIYRSFSTDGSTEEGASKTSYSDTDLSECSQNEEEEDLEDFSCVSQEKESGFLEDATFYTERKKPSPTVQQASSLPSKKQSRKSNQKSHGEDVSCVFQEQDSGFLDDVTFYAERKKSSPTALSLSSKKQSKTSNQTSQVITTTRRCLSPCGKYVKKTPVKKQVLAVKQSVRISTENGIFCSKPTVANPTSLEKVQSQMSNYNAISSTSCEAKKVELSNFRIPKKNSLSGKHLGKSQFTVGQKSGDLCGGKRMSVAPSKLDNNLLDSSKDCTGKNTQKDISTIKTPPHILKHSVSYFASTTKKPNTKPKLPRPSTTTKDIPKPQEKRETSFVRGKDNSVSLKEPLADLDVMVNVTVDKSPQIQNQVHSCDGQFMAGGDRRDLGRPQKSEKVHKALAPTEAGCFEVPASHEVPRMSVGGYEEKLARSTIDLTQEKKFTKTSWPKPTEDWCDGVQDVFHAKDRKLSSGTEELLTTSTYAASEAKARRCISSTEETVAHTATAQTSTSDNILPAKVRNLLFGTEKAVPDITSMHTASEDVFPAIARRLSFGTEETVPQTTATHTTSDAILSAKSRRHISSTEDTVTHTATAYTASDGILARARKLSYGTEETLPHTTTTHTARSNVGHSSKSENVSILEEEAIHAKVSNWSVQNGKLCKVCEPPLGNLERVTSTSGVGTVVPSYVTKSVQPIASHDCSTTANCKVAPTQATRSPSVHNQPSSTGSVPVLGADQHVHCKGVKQSAISPEVLCISEKSQQNESTKWQRPRSPKSFLMNYWSKTESKDTKSDDLKDRSAEDITVLNDSYSRLVDYSNNAENTDCKEEDTRSHNVKEETLENTPVVSDSYSRLVSYSATSKESIISQEEPSSDLMKNYSQSKVCAMKVLSKDNTNFPDEKSLTVSKEECKIFRTTETQTSETFVRISQVQTEGFVDLRGDSQKQDLYAGSVDVKVSLEEREGSAVSSLTGPIEQSSWTQPKALYATVDRRPQEQYGSEVKVQPQGQEQAAVIEVRGHDGSEVEPRGQEETVRDEVTSHEGSEVDSRGQEEAAGDKARGHDGSEVGQVNRNQVSVAMVTPQGSRPVVMSAQPSDTSLHPAPPVPELQQSHPIVLLNELCQRNHLPMCFQDISVTGPAHRPRVKLAAVVGDCTFQAEASSKKAARRQAAREALQALYREGYK
ncbi:hypothetical protein Bbelb_286130 [Branchiostoma belcheri]|nr:hypothetical protein Bbelb_286130 [Branchiostoma belcheri]